MSKLPGVGAIPTKKAYNREQFKDLLSSALQDQRLGRLRLVSKSSSGGIIEWPSSFKEEERPPFNKPEADFYAGLILKNIYPTKQEFKLKLFEDVKKRTSDEEGRKRTSEELRRIGFSKTLEDAIDLAANSHSYLHHQGKSYGLDLIKALNEKGLNLQQIGKLAFRFRQIMDYGTFRFNDEETKFETVDRNFARLFIKDFSEHLKSDPKTNYDELRRELRVYPFACQYNLRFNEYLPKHNEIFNELFKKQRLTEAELDDSFEDVGETVAAYCRSKYKISYPEYLKLHFGFKGVEHAAPALPLLAGISENAETIKNVLFSLVRHDTPLTRYLVEQTRSKASFDQFSLATLVFQPRLARQALLSGAKPTKKGINLLLAASKQNSALRDWRPTPQQAAAALSLAEAYPGANASGFISAFKAVSKGVPENLVSKLFEKGIVPQNAGDYSWFQRVEDLLRKTDIAPEYDELHALFPEKSVDPRKAAVLYFLNARLKSALPAKTHLEINAATGAIASRIPLSVMLSIIEGTDSNALKRLMQKSSLKPHAETITDIVNLLDSATQAAEAAAKPKKIKVKTRAQSAQPPAEQVLGPTPNFTQIFSVGDKIKWLSGEIEKSCGSKLPNGITSIDIAWFLRAFLPSGEGGRVTVKNPNREAELARRANLGKKWPQLLEFALKEGLVAEAQHPVPGYRKFGLVTNTSTRKLSLIAKDIYRLTILWHQQH